MCGIVGYIGKRNTLSILIDGLRKLEYRGYDSAGIAYLNDSDIKVIKSIGRIKDLEEKLNFNDNGYLGIGHTRWATHGKVSELNCHPHEVGEIILVHNGIIENYLEIKNFLINKGYSFYGETDTEVAAGYIDYEYKISIDKDIISVLDKCMKKFVGSYAMGIIVKSIKDKLFVIKKDNPLVILRGSDEYFIASDVSAYESLANDYIVLNDFEIGVVSNNAFHIYKDNNLKLAEINLIDKKNDIANLRGFKHYMLKEIHEQASLIDKWNKLYLNDLNKINDLSIYKKIHIIGCGTAYHAGLVGKYLIENYGNIEVQVFIASEYRYQKLFVDKDTLVIAVSQSGETADTLACIKRVKELKAKTLGIINVRESSIARIVDEVIYTEAGQEIAVASTKAYMAQIYIFSLLAVKLGIKSNLLNKNFLADYEKLPKFISEIIKNDYQKIGIILSKQDKIFYLGRSIDYCLMMEGALKIKEISYINSEAYPAGELKHGTISLIDEETWVVASITEYSVAKKTISNIIEVKSRGARVVLLISEDLLEFVDSNIYDELIVLPSLNLVLRPLLGIVPLQLLAYYTALVKGCDIDKPRNLAKSVTVE